MFDIGVNLDHSSYLDSLPDFEQQFLQQDVTGIICIASNLVEAEQLQQHCAPYNSMSYTLGCHPHHASTWQDQDQQTLLEWFGKDTKAVAIGEMGLDFNRNYSTPDEQRRAFAAQLELAQQVKKPVYLHERDAFAEMQTTLRQHALPSGGVIHCFTGNRDQMERYLELGLYVGITGWLLDERRNQDLIEAVKHLPLERLLLETDAPYLLPRNIRPRPKRNHPQYLPYIAQAVADIKQISLEEVRLQTRQNTQQLFFAGANMPNTSLGR
ncbi:TatD family hydrolase [Marinomonas ostreistagni]|uniref:TatD family hydrolase n=1 Tax=Marinomonas ostreistagni TaxID=359209 RepID=UPI00195069DF|nr:TatD family hydrolase [Marinomonas ostreistagni]MBM6550023.1 TatD family hydrolase [Marinomonas ostreistagni]